MTPSRPPKPSKPSSSATAPARNPYALNPNPEVVDPRWLLRALGIILLLALVCGYLTLCALFYQGQWQFVLHPTRSVPAPATIAGASFEAVHFGPDESATPQLTGWWLPVASDGRYAADTVLYLPSGDGSLADSSATPVLAALHAAGINLFTFDYRGYGQSAALHPNQRRMEQDAAAAWQYLSSSRHLAPSRIVLFGSGVGAALATQLAAQHSEVPALLLDAPRPDLLDLIRADPRTTLLPVRLLFHDRFEIAPTLASLATPKLLILHQYPASHPQQHAAQQAEALARNAASPKYTLYLAPADGAVVLAPAFTRFFDQYLPAASDPKPLPTPR